jgi:trk system potassium uptake protein TrkH
MERHANEPPEDPAPGTSDFRPPMVEPPRRRLLDPRRRPGVLAIGGFAAAIAVGTALLMLPVSTAGAARATGVEALFTATSAVCVTGLIVVDTPSYWSPFGHGVILALIQLGGLGILATASLLGLLISRRMGLHTRLVAAAETRTIDLGDVRTAVVGVLAVSALVEGVVAAVVTVRFMTTYGEPFGRAAWLGVFHGVSAFNNAGFALFSDNLVGFVADPWICLPITLAVIVGGVGFPVIIELRHRLRRPSRWSLHTKITLTMTALLVAVGTALVTVAEWSNPRTLGALDVPGKLLAGFVQGVMPRTAGFNSVDIAGMSSGTWFGTDILMFIGGGSAGTAGGIKVTTVAVIVMLMVSELRGDPDVTIFDRRVLAFGQRQAVSIALLGFLVVALGTLTLELTTTLSLGESLYEVISAFSLVGLSTGITAQLQPWQQLLLVALMFVGRLGPVTFASTLALRQRERAIHYPVSLPIMG